MSSVEFAPPLPLRRRISLAHIDAVVSARLGPTRGLDNSQPAAFNRQIAMYLAKHVGRWTTTVIGRFYNGRDHSTVCYCTQKVASLRRTNPEIEALVTELKQILENPTADLAVQQRLAAFAHLKPELSQSDLDGLARSTCRSRILPHSGSLQYSDPEAGTKLCSHLKPSRFLSLRAEFS